MSSVPHKTYASEQVFTCTGGECVPGQSASRPPSAGKEHGKHSARRSVVPLFVVLSSLLLIVAGVAGFIWYRRRKAQQLHQELEDQIVMGQIVSGTVTGIAVVEPSNSDTAPMIGKVIP